MRSSTVSIELFGAVGDGVKDDTAAFESMVTYLADNGGVGILPYGTYLISSSIRTFSNNKPFTIRGEGKRLSILKNRTPTTSFLYWTGANRVGFEDLTLDGDYSGTQSGLASGGHLVFVNSSYNTVRNVSIQKFRRVAVMIFNDHQTTTSNLYGGHICDGVEVIGTNQVNGEGPSAFILADVNDSRVVNCYIENIGLYGYEYKNDSSRNFIQNCIAKACYYPIYFGGNGARTDLRYVKNSIVDSVICDGGFNHGITLGLSDNNRIQNVTMINGIYQNIRLENSNGNTISGISSSGTRADLYYPIVYLKNGSSRNSLRIDVATVIGDVTPVGLVVADSGCNDNLFEVGMVTGGAGVPGNVFADSGSNNVKKYLSQ